MDTRIAVVPDNGIMDKRKMVICSTRKIKTHRYEQGVDIEEFTVFQVPLHYLT